MRIITSVTLLAYPTGRNLSFVISLKSYSNCSRSYRIAIVVLEKYESFEGYGEVIRFDSCIEKAICFTLAMREGEITENG